MKKRKEDLRRKGEELKRREESRLRRIKEEELKKWMVNKQAYSVTRYDQFFAVDMAQNNLAKNKLFCVNFTHII